MALGTELGLGPGHIVPDGFSAHAYCSQAAGCIKMPLGMEVGFSPGDIVLDGDPAPPEEGTAAPSHFSAHVYYCLLYTSPSPRD